MSSKRKWIKGIFKGVRYYKHPTRKNGVKFDRCFSGSYQFNGKRKFMGFGWESEGFKESDVFSLLQKYRENARKGKGPTTFKEEKALIKAEQEEKEQAIKKKTKEALTINDYFYQRYYPRIQKEKKLKTYQREESLFRIWINKNIGNLTFKQISKSDIENIFYDIVDAGKSIRTAEYTLTTLKQIYREAKSENYSFDMPVISKTLKKRISQNNNARLRFLSHAEAEALLEGLKKKSIDLYEKALISLHCGLRASEIFNLRWSRVDFEHGIFNIIDSKGKDRSVHMSEQVKEVFLNKVKGKPDSLIYPGRQGKVSGQISQVFRQVANKLFNEGITDRREKVTFHTLRHTCASWMVMQGISLYLVQKVLGHSTIQVTEKYSHLAPDQLQLAAGAIDKVAGKNNIIPFQKKA